MTQKDRVLNIGHVIDEEALGGIGDVKQVAREVESKSEGYFGNFADDGRSFRIGEAKKFRNSIADDDHAAGVGRDGGDLASAGVGAEEFGGDRGADIDDIKGPGNHRALDKDKGAGAGG